MIRHYLITTLRQLVRQRGFSIINIVGLSFGIAISILIYLWVQHELSYDRYNTNSSRLFRLVQTQYYTSGPLTTVCMPGPIAKDLRKDIPEIVNSFTFYFLSLTVSHNEKRFTEEVCLADPEIFEMFDFDFLKGDKHHVFMDYKSIVLTEKMAEKLFEGKDPIGQIVTLNNESDYKVTGIIKEVPKNSTLRFDLCIPFENIESMGFTINRYGWNSYYVYTQLEKNIDYQDVNLKIRKYLEDKSRKQNLAQGNEEYDSNIDLFLFPLEKMHLYNYRPDGQSPVQFIYIFSAIAVFIILIACINFMNLSTARATKRTKEISIRKSIGANRRILIGQFLGESITIVVLAMILALAMANLLLPYFNQLVNKSLSFPFANPAFWLLIVVVTFLIGLLAGSYPAFYLSSFNPVKTLRNGMNKGKGNFYFRRALVVFQFVLSVILIISTIVINRQLDYLYNNKLGMDLSNVILLRMRGNLKDKYDVLKNEFQQVPGIESLTRSNAIPFYIGSNSGGLEWQDKTSGDDILVGFTFTDVDYMKTMGMTLLEGRYFSDAIQSDTAAVVINETAARAFGMKDPVGKWISWGDDERNTIIGVVKDFHHLPMQNNIDPLTLYYAPDRCRYILLKTSGRNSENINLELEKRWNKVASEFPYEPTYLKDIYERTYSSEARLIRIIGYFAVLAILISCLGLFALSTYLAEQRRKEIGIRKVLGATAQSIISLVTREFFYWVLAANLISWPIAWMVLKNWLQGYAYHTRISPDIFIITLFLSLIIALLTVAYQSLNSAHKKPVDSIKYQ